MQESQVVDTSPGMTKWKRLFNALTGAQEKSAPIFAAFHQWVEDLLPATPPHSALGKALSYTHNQWNKLVLHLEHEGTWQACHSRSRLSHP